MAMLESFTDSTAVDSAVNGGDGVTAADDGGGTVAGGCSDSFGHFESAPGERGHFEYSHRTVPDDSLCRGNFQAIGVDGLGADIEPHPAVGGGGNRQRLRGGAGLEFGADDMIDRQEECEFPLLRCCTQAASEVHPVFVFVRPPDRQPFGLYKRL